MVPCRLLRLAQAAGGSADRRGLVGPAIGCIRRSIAPHRTGNHGQAMCARQAPLIGGLRSPGRLCPVRRGSLSRARRNCSGVRNTRARGYVALRGCAAADSDRPASVRGGLFPADPAQDDHADDAASKAGSSDGMAGPAALRHLNTTRVVGRSVSWFYGRGLSLGGGGMRTGISPMFESCLPPPHNALPCVHGREFMPERGPARYGSR